MTTRHPRHVEPDRVEALSHGHLAGHGPGRHETSTGPGIVRHADGATTPLSGARVLALQHSAGNAAASAAVVQRRAQEVGAEDSGFTLTLDGRSRAPGQSGYSQMLEGASAQLAQDMIQQGDVSNLVLGRVNPDFSGVPEEQRFWLRQKAEAESHMGTGVMAPPPSITAFLTRQRDGAQAQLNAIAISGDDLRSMAMNFNSFVPQGNEFVRSATRLSAMQSLLGATNTQHLAAALLTGLTQAGAAAAQYQTAFRAGSGAAAEHLDLPGGDASLREATDGASTASRNLGVAYRDFRINVLGDAITALTAAGEHDRSRLAEINQNKQMINQIGQTIDLAMNVVSPGGLTHFFSPTSDIPDAAREEIGKHVPSVGGAMNFIADIAYESEVQQINQRLGALDSLMTAERATIDYDRYQRNREHFQGALHDFAERMTQLQDRMRARREQYRNLGENLDRFARSRGGAGGAAVGTGQEHFTTILTVVAGIREMLSLARWGRSRLDESGITPDAIRQWVGQVGGDTRPSGAAAQRWRAGGLTEGERTSVASIFSQVSQFEAAANTAQSVFGEVDQRAGDLMGSAALRGTAGPGTY